jgi:hypothetical protein
LPISIDRKTVHPHRFGGPGFLTLLGSESYTHPRIYYCDRKSEYFTQYPNKYICLPVSWGSTKNRYVFPGGVYPFGRIYVGESIEDCIAKAVADDPACLFYILAVPPARIYNVTIFIEANNRTVIIKKGVNY